MDPQRPEAAPAAAMISCAPAYMAPELVPLRPSGAGQGAIRRVAGIAFEAPAIARSVAHLLDTISRAADLEALRQAAESGLAPLAGARAAWLGTKAEGLAASGLPDAFAGFREHFPALESRASASAGFAWERHGESYIALFPLQAHSTPVGHLLLTGAAGRVLHLIAASATLLVLNGPLALAVANLNPREPLAVE